MIRCLFVEKKKEFNVQTKRLQNDLAVQLGLEIQDIRIFVRYYTEGISDSDYAKAVKTIFSESPIDRVYKEKLPKLKNYCVAAIELLPGQFDQRADSAAQCIQLLTQKERPLIRCATVYAFKTKPENLKKILRCLINPVEAQQAALKKPLTLQAEIGKIEKEKIIEGFCSFDEEKLKNYHKKHGLAMSLPDLKFIQKYFKKEKRDPKFLELKVLDTYWSDHCRHTTFWTRLDKIKIFSDNPHIAAALAEYQKLHNDLYKDRTDKYPCLMDIATIAAKELKKRGVLKNLDESDEINACSIKVTADIDGQPEDWLVMFKNETHNHPTEIEPFGGAATCLGGAIRDPLSGRVYVYHAMRVTGAADPRLQKTLKGKLSQRTLTTTAAAGFSAYGNQIGLATGLVSEIYHEKYVAKRLEAGFVVGAAPAKNICRAKPQPGDVVLLIGGATGRDGCGGATGSSKAHDLKSVGTCSAEVQKGNPPVERKIQRLFRDPEFSRLIKKCNDFGAGGISVAVGELAPGLDIFLDKVPKKYQGLTALELAISESQERMAVVISKADAEKAECLCRKENLDCTIIANITAENRMQMFYAGEIVADLKRELVDSHGVLNTISAEIHEKNSKYRETPPAEIATDLKKDDYSSALKKEMAQLNVCSQKGLSEMFDSTIGTGTILMPFGNDTQITPALAMAAKLPIENGDTNTATVAAYGCDPYFLSASPFLGALYAVIDSVVKVVAAGADFASVKLTFQEYFMRLRTDPKRWGVPLSALLGAFKAQIELEIAAIGGKDSISGSFENLDVPPTLISFALGIGKADKIITNCLREKDQKLFVLPLRTDQYSVPDFQYFIRLMKKISAEIENENINFATVTGQGGAYAAVTKSVLGSENIGFVFEKNSDFFKPQYGNIIIACRDIDAFADFDKMFLGKTTEDRKIVFGTPAKESSVTKTDILQSYTETLEDIFPTKARSAKSNKISNLSFSEKNYPVSKFKTTAPNVLIPVWPGTNCEYDTAKQFLTAGAKPKIFVLNNLSPHAVEESLIQLENQIQTSQIIALAGGFSGGDEPDGSGKLIVTTFSNPRIKDAISEFLAAGGLIIGICNGFQALVKLGLLPFSEIKPLAEDSPTLTFNNINRHVSTISTVRIASTNSPWLANVSVGELFAVPISHGEGRFVCSKKDLDTMIRNGQIFSQYADPRGDATYISSYNPNGSLYGIEGIISPDGRILGKMGHTERVGKNLMKNIYLQSDMKIFESGVKYFL